MARTADALTPMLITAGALLYAGMLIANAVSIEALLR
jgi:hypothetical protein